MANCKCPPPKLLIPRDWIYYTRLGSGWTRSNFGTNRLSDRFSGQARTRPQCHSISYTERVSCFGGQHDLAQTLFTVRPSCFDAFLVRKSPGFGRLFTKLIEGKSCGPCVFFQLLRLCCKAIYSFGCRLSFCSADGIERFLLRAQTFQLTAQA